MRDKFFVLWIAVFMLGEMPMGLAELQKSADLSEQRATYSSRSMISQKLQLVKMLLETSQALERAAASDDEKIKQKVVIAKNRFNSATDMFDKDNLAEAEENADEALRLIEEISQTIPDQQQVRIEQKMRYEESVKSLRNAEATLQDLSSRLQPNEKSSELKGITEFTRKQKEKAAGLASEDRFPDAIELLKSAHERVISALNKLLGSTALLYDLKFKSIVEEYDYELARYHSFEELAPIAYVELRPDKDTIMLSERYVQESRTMRDAAMQQAAKGDHRAAINTLLDAIKNMQTALRVVGLVLQE